MDSLNKSLQNSLPDYAYSPLEKQHYHPFHLYRNLTIFILFLIISLFIILNVGYITLVSKVQQKSTSQKHTTTPPPVACTQDAKQCPDGSYVSRTGPNCAFAPCPTQTIDPTANWKTYQSRSNKYIFDYPSDLSLEITSSIYLKKGPESNLSLLIEIAPEVKYVSEKEKSFRDWAVEQFQVGCLADGAGSSSRCDKVIKETSFTNKYGLEVYEIYLNLVQTNVYNNSLSSQTRGPMFAIDVSEKTNNATYGLLVIPSYGFPDKNEEEITRKIIDTIRFE